MNKEFFVVQRCWYSSPRQIQPMDYLRLFEHQQDAEKAAFHSAAAWSRHHSGSESVRTLLLPSYPAHNRNGSSYGFIAQGSLFWVRSVMASTSTSAASSAPLHDLNAPCTRAHVVLTEGVIGGTGNRNSRRGTEVPSGRVFLETANIDEAARYMSQEACRQVAANLPQDCNIQVITVPVGEPADYSSQAFLNDWPPQVLMASDNNNDSSMPPAFFGTSPTQNKRGSAHCIGFHEGATEVECPFSVQPAKRRRFCGEEASAWWKMPGAAMISEDEMQMS